MEKDLKYAALLDCYGSLLTEKQSLAVEMYYCDDLSLSEIAEHMGITRQGVRDVLKHAEEELQRLENGLGLYAKSALLAKISAELSDYAEKSKDETLLNLSALLNDIAES